MKQPRLNHVILLHMNKERLGRLDLDIIGNEFVSGIEKRLPSSVILRLSMRLCM